MGAIVFVSILVPSCIIGWWIQKFLFHYKESLKHQKYVPKRRMRKITRRG